MAKSLDPTVKAFIPRPTHANLEKPFKITYFSI